MILLVLKKIQKNKKKSNLQKRKKLRDQFENLAIFPPINTGFLNTFKKGGNFDNIRKKIQKT